MQVRIREDDERLGLKAGEIYEAMRYRYDPDKITLLKRVPDGHDPCCNQYKHEVDYFLQGQWKRIVDNMYMPVDA